MDNPLEERFWALINGLNVNSIIFVSAGFIILGAFSLYAIATLYWWTKSFETAAITATVGVLVPSGVLCVIYLNEFVTLIRDEFFCNGYTVSDG